MSTFQKKNPNDMRKFSEASRTQLEKLGFNNGFDSKSQESLAEDLTPARVTEVNRNSYKINDGRYEMAAELSGRFLFTSESPEDYPTVGDWVAVQSFDDHTLAIIHRLLPRKSLLKRKDPGKAIEFQLIAANIDDAFIVQSADANFNLNRLERYLVMVHESGIRPIVVLSKTDLISEGALADVQETVHRLNDRYPVLPVSSVTGQGLVSLKKELLPGKTYCLLGSSGVGKTTLLNTLLGERRYDVAEVRKKDDKGRHTTARRQLTLLAGGSIFIDTPGMRELGNFAVDTGLRETFDEIVSFGSRCRFKDCSHIHETGCAVIEAVNYGLIDEARYKNYLAIQKESAYYAMSYLDKRKKDKQFGKMLKNYKKGIRKK